MAAAAAGSAVAAMPTARMATGAAIPLVGLGTWKAGTGEVAAAVKHALKVGYRHLDCASDYANEAEVGQGIAEAIKEFDIKREDIWVTSKLWNTNHSKEHVRWACEESLKDLGLDYLDLYLIHFPIAMKHTEETKRSGAPIGPDGKVEFAPVSIMETWQAMEELVDAGLVRHIGVSNFSSALLMDVLRYARIRPAVNQIEIHPYLTMDRLVTYCQENDVHVTAFSPFGSPSYVPRGFDGGEPSPMSLDVIKGIAGKHGVSPGQVVLRWGTQRGISVIPKSSNPSRIEENLGCVSFTLDDEDMKAISALNKNRRFNDPVSFWGADIWAGGH